MGGKERQKSSGGGGFLSYRHIGSRKRKLKGWAGTLQGVYVSCHIASKNKLCTMAVPVYSSASKLTYFRRGPEDFIQI